MRILFVLSYIVIIVSDIKGQAFEWKQINNCPASPRYETLSFVVNNKAYVGTGAFLNSSLAIYNDIWEYSPTTDLWTQKANYGGGNYYGVAAFSLNNLGFAGTGWNPMATNTFYSFDPVTNSWSGISSFPGTPRYDATGIAAQNMGFIGLGYAPNTNDWYAYDATNDVWSTKSNFPSFPRQSSSQFELNGIIYIVCGGDASGNVYNDNWAYDPSTNTWTQKAFFPGTPRFASYHFSICNFGIVGGGRDSSLSFTDYFMFDPINNLWDSLPSNALFPYFKGSNFSLLDEGYLGFGRSINNTFTNSFYKLQLKKPLIEILSDSCGLLSFQALNVNSLINYIWDFGDGTTYSGISPTHTYNQAGTYTVTLHYSYECISKQTDTTIIVPTAGILDSQFSATIDSCSNTITLNPSVTSLNHIWLFGNGSSSNQTNPSFTYSQPGNYSITHIIFDSCIADTTIAQITINESGIQNYFIPNSFSPNYDGLNDYFNVISRNKCDEIEIIIYNRWGNYLLSINQKFSPGWDGRINGTECPAGVYVYEVKINHQIKRGFVHLYR